MKKTGIILLIIGILIVLEALIKGEGNITIDRAIFSLTIINLSYLLYLTEKNDKKIENLTFQDIILRRNKSEEKNKTVNIDIKEENFQLLNKFSNIRIKSLIEVTIDPRKRVLLENELEKRKRFKMQK